MPNDAKLGLLAGVLGVIIVSVLSANRQQPTPPAHIPPGMLPRAPTKPPAKPAAEAIPNARADTPAVLPADLSSTPVARTKDDPVAKPAARTRDDDIDP